MTSSDAVAIELRKLLRQSGDYLAGLVGVLALGFVSFPIFTRVFSVSDFGLIDYVQKIVLLVTAGAKLGLQHSALRFYHGTEFVSDRAAARRYYSTLFFSVGLTAAVVTAIFTAAMFRAPQWLIDAPLAGLLGVAGSLILLRALESVLWAFLRVEERTKTYSAVNVAIKAGTIAAVCVLLTFGRSPRVYFAGSIAVELVAVALLTIWLMRRGLIDRAGFDWSLARHSVAFGVPLIAYELAGLVLGAGDRFLVRHYLGGQALGLYSVAYGLSSYINEILITPLNLALIPIYMRLWASEGRARTAEFLSSGLDLFVMAAVGLLAGACALSRDGILLLASPKYRGADSLIPLLVAGLLVYTSGAFLSAGLLIQKRTITMAKLLLAAAAANVGLNIFLLPRMGLQAAALVLFVSYVFCMLLLGRASFRVLPLRVDAKAMARYCLAAGLAWGAASRIGLGSPLLNVAARGATLVLVYGGLLCGMDRRVRALARRLLPLHRELSEINPLSATESMGPQGAWSVIPDSSQGDEQTATISDNAKTHSLSH